jgi:16S rRNA G966 N2-methylase RsmD
MAQEKTLDEIRVSRTDPAYNAHSYLTKIPVSAIAPFLYRYSEPGETVLDPFAGSGMTGVAAAMAHRKAMLVDISELGRHVGTNYLNFVDLQELGQTAALVAHRADEAIRYPYSIACRRCGEVAVLSRSVWSIVYRCPECSGDVIYYDALRQRGSGGSMTCTTCDHPFERRKAERVGEVRVLDIISCGCSRNLLEQEPWSREDEFGRTDKLPIPDLPIDADREMYRRSALGRHGLTSTAKFFSRRNLGTLAALHREILEVKDDRVRAKLLFVFTAILPRASKRYQWGPKRPLNAQNQTYYVAPVFLEWNVLDLFRRKHQAMVRSDQFVLAEIGPLFASSVDVEYVIASADDLSFLEDDSVDYVFTDPPFGSNLFYSDMNLFQEAWLGTVTDRTREAVIPTNGDRRSAGTRYGKLLSGALSECMRVLKPGRYLSLVFSNSSGSVWAFAQRAIHESGFVLEQDGVTLLDKGQRSVKGLTSGYEGVVTTDLVLTMKKPHSRSESRVDPPGESLRDSVAAILKMVDCATPSRLYLQVVRRYLRFKWDLSSLDFGHVLESAAALGLRIDPRSGLFLETNEARVS